MAPITRAAVLASAIFSIVFLAPQGVSATDTKLLDFPNCVEQCIRSNGCKDINSAKCMCGSARETNMLAKVVGCMSKTCNQQINPKSAFIDVMKAGCSALKLPIPDDKIMLAELAAQQGGVVTTVRPTPVTTSRGPAPSESKTQSQSESQSSSTTTTSAESSEDRSQPSSTAGPDTTTNPAPAPAPTTTTTTLQPAANTPRPDPREPTDSSPFATPIEAAGGRMVPPSWVWAVGAIAVIGGLR